MLDRIDPVGILVLTDEDIVHEGRCFDYTGCWIDPVGIPILIDEDIHGVQIIYKAKRIIWEARRSIPLGSFDGKGTPSLCLLVFDIWRRTLLGPSMDPNGIQTDRKP